MGQTSSRYHLDTKSPFNLTRWHQMCRKRLNFSLLRSWGFIEGSLKSSLCSKSNCSYCSTEVSPAPTISSALDNLLSVIGNVGFQFAVWHLENNNYGTAVSLLKFGTRCRNANATYNLGICYKRGIGVKEDHCMAMQCFYAASNLGHPRAMYNLGVFYARGIGGLQLSREMAKLCFIAASVLGQEEAVAVLDSGYPQIVRQLKDLDNKDSTNVSLFISLITDVFNIWTTFVPLLFTITITYVRVAEQRSRHRHFAMTISLRKRQRIFQPKMMNGLKYRMKTRLLEGQPIAVC